MLFLSVYIIHLVDPWVIKEANASRVTGLQAKSRTRPQVSGSLIGKEIVVLL
jgi:hypothetical protein